MGARSVHTPMAGWPAGALVPSSPKVRLGLDHRSAQAHNSPHPPSPAWLLKLAQISKQAGSQQQQTVFGTVRTRAPPLPGYTATGELPGLEVPFVSRGLPRSYPVNGIKYTRGACIPVGRDSVRSCRRVTEVLCWGGHPPLNPKCTARTSPWTVLVEKSMES